MRILGMSFVTASWLIGAIIFLIIKMSAMWWLSDVMYSTGWWPMGAGLRVLVWVEALAVIAGVGALIIGGIGAFINYLGRELAW